MKRGLVLVLLLPLLNGCGCGSGAGDGLDATENAEEEGEESAEALVTEFCEGEWTFSAPEFNCCAPAESSNPDTCGGLEISPSSGTVACNSQDGASYEPAVTGTYMGNHAGSGSVEDGRLVMTFSSLEDEIDENCDMDGTYTLSVNPDDLTGELSLEMSVGAEGCEAMTVGVFPANTTSCGGSATVSLTSGSEGAEQDTQQPSDGAYMAYATRLPDQALFEYDEVTCGTEGRWTFGAYSDIADFRENNENSQYTASAETDFLAEFNRGWPLTIEREEDPDDPCFQSVEGGIWVAEGTFLDETFNIPLIRENGFDACGGCRFDIVRTVTCDLDTLACDPMEIVITEEDPDDVTSDCSYQMGAATEVTCSTPVTLSVPWWMGI